MTRRTPPRCRTCWHHQRFCLCARTLITEAFKDVETFDGRINPNHPSVWRPAENVPRWVITNSRPFPTNDDPDYWKRTTDGNGPIGGYWGL